MLSRIAVDLRGGDFLADGIFHQVAQARGFLDPQAGFAPEVENELAAVGIGKEILAEPRHEQKGAQTNREKDRHKKKAAADETLELPVITVAHPLETAFESPLESREDAARRGGDRASP